MLDRVATEQALWAVEKTFSALRANLSEFFALRPKQSFFFEEGFLSSPTSAVNDTIELLKPQDPKEDEDESKKNSYVSELRQ